MTNAKWNPYLNYEKGDVVYLSPDKGDEGFYRCEGKHFAGPPAPIDVPSHVASCWSRVTDLLE